MRGCIENMVESERIFSYIDTILKENGYKSVNVRESIGCYIREMQDGENFEYALYQSSGKYTQYILVLDIGKTKIDEIDINNRQRTIYQKLQELGEELKPEFDKNVSLLLCVNGDITEEKLEKEILKIEENPYCFKKLVLTYIENEIQSLIGKLGEENIWNYMQKCMMELQEDKLKVGDESINFVLKLFIKIPFLAVEIVKKHKKADLLNEIEKQLEQKYMPIWNDIKEMDLPKIEEMKNYSEKQIDDILNKWYVKEEAK